MPKNTASNSTARGRRCNDGTRHHYPAPALRRERRLAFTLSLNTNPLVNRFADPDDLIDTIAYGIGIRDVQLTHEFVNPGWPAATIVKFLRLFKKALARTGVRITSGMTGPYGRLNHFGHPDADVRRYYVDWFKTFADISAELGAPGMG